MGIIRKCDTAIICHEEALRPAKGLIQKGLIMNKTGKILRIIAVILFGLTTAMNLLGGIGTSCVAFSSNVGYRMAFKELMDYRWLYQALVITTILLGAAGIWGLVQLIRGGSKVYRNALILLIIGSVLGGVHYFSSLALRGEAAPANVKFYLNLFTLIVFLVYKLPGVREQVNFDQPGGKSEIKAAAGAAAMIAGLLCLTVFHWAGPSHTTLTENWTYVLYYPLVIAGLTLVVVGIMLSGKAMVELLSTETRTAVILPSEIK